MPMPKCGIHITSRSLRDDSLRYAEYLDIAFKFSRLHPKQCAGLWKCIWPHCLNLLDHLERCAASTELPENTLPLPEPREHGAKIPQVIPTCRLVPVLHVELHPWALDNRALEQSTECLLILLLHLIIARTQRSRDLINGLPSSVDCFLRMTLNLGLCLLHHRVDANEEILSGRHLD